MQDVMEIPQAHVPSPAKVSPLAGGHTDVQHNSDQDTCNDGFVHVSVGGQPDTPVEPTAAAAVDPPQAQQAEPSTAAVPHKVCLEWVEAAKSGDTVELRRLLKAHPGLLNQQVGGLQCTATHWAAANGHSDTLQYLLEWGADITIQTATGCLPLHSAAAAGWVECVQQLLATDPALQQQQLTAQNEDGLTAAALALRHGHKLLQGLLVQAAASAQDPQGAEAAQHGTACCPGSGDAQQVHQQQHQQQQQQPSKQQPGMRRGFLLSGQHSSTTQATHADATCGDSNAMNASSSVGVTAAPAAAPPAAAEAGDAQHWDSTVDNPLFGVSCSPAKHPHQHKDHPAAQRSSRMGPEATPTHDVTSSPKPAGLEAVVVTEQAAAAAAAGSSAQLPCEVGSQEGPVHTGTGCPQAVQQQDAFPAPSSSSAAAPAAAAAAGPSVTPPAAAATRAAAAPAPAAGVDRTTGRSWLDAARAGDLPLLQALLQQVPQLLDYRGAGISYAFVGNSALHWAAAKGHRACVMWLLQQGASVGAVNEAGSTALHTAVEHQQPGCAGVLVLQGGADVQAEDGYGQRVASLAGTRGSRGSSSSSRGGVLAEQLLLWDQARKLQQQDRSAWSNVAMQRLLQLAGKSAEAAKCLEKHELVELAAAELERVVRLV